MKRVRLTSLLGIAAVASLGCQAIIGIEDMDPMGEDAGGVGGAGAAGAAGSSGGAAGNGGNAGSGGSAGALGKGGHAGAGGTSGTGGAAGTAGFAGSAGSGGTSGSGGNSGSGGAAGDSGSGGAAASGGLTDAGPDADEDSSVGGAAGAAGSSGEGGTAGQDASDDVVTEAASGGAGGEDASADVALESSAGGSSGEGGASGQGGAGGEDAGPDASLPPLGSDCLFVCGDSTCHPSESCMTCPECTCSGECGNGTLESQENCDDANQDPADFCTSSCTRQEIKANAAGALGTFAGIEDLGDGTLLAVWNTSGGDTKMRRFVYSGAPIDSADLDPLVSTTGVQYAIGAFGAGDGTFQLLWSTDQPAATLLGRRFSNGCPEPIPLTGDSILDLPASTLTGDDLSPTAPLTIGGFVLAWGAQGLASADTDGSAIYFRRYSAASVPLDASPVLVNATAVGDQKHAAVAPLDDGGFAVTWTDAAVDGSGMGIRARLFSSTGAPVTSELAVNTITSGDQSGPVAARLPGLGFVVAWTDKSGASKEVRFRRFSSTGTALDAEELQANTNTGGYQSVTHVASNKSGDFLVVWTDGAGCEFSCANENVTGRIFSKTAAPLHGTDIPLAATSTGFQGQPRATALPSGDFVVGYRSGSDARLNRIELPSSGM